MPVVPGTPGADLPPGSDALIRRIQELERAVRELAAANPLATAGLVPAPNALTVQGNLNVTGTETVSGNLNVTGTETVSGNLNVTGTETVGGKLSSSDWDGTDHSHLGTTGWVLGRDGTGPSYLALNGTDIATLIARQVLTDSVTQSSAAMAFTTTATVYSSFVFTIPAGFTHATIFATGSGRCLNTTASTQYFFGQTRVDTTEGAWRQGGTQQTTLSAGYQGTFNAPLATTIAVVPTHSMTLSVNAWTSAATTAQSGNYVGIDAVVIYTV